MSGALPSSTSGTYPVFPNGPYISKFFLLSSQNSGLNHLDIDLYNRCYLPYNPLPYNDNNNAKRSGVSKPDYQSDEPPCKRQAAINSNCYFTWNGTLESIEVRKDAAQQQDCFCGTYPFFEAVGGCQDCFEEHGGIEGYHWFPPSFISAASATYCSANPLSTGFYPFVSQWALTAAAAQIPSTTAKDALGTSTAASLYYTPSASSTTTKSSQAISNTNVGTKQRARLLVVLLLAVRLVG